MIVYIVQKKNYKSLKISIGSIIKNPEMQRFVPYHLENQKICKRAVKELLFVVRYVPGRYKIHEMCDKAFLEKGETLKSVPDSYRNK